MKRKLSKKKIKQVQQGIEDENIEYIIRNHTKNPPFEGEFTTENLIKHGIELVEDFENSQQWITQFKEPICLPVYLKGKNPRNN